MVAAPRAGNTRLDFPLLRRETTYQTTLTEDSGHIFFIGVFLLQFVEKYPL
jgi:hypothetical protein